MGHDTEQHNTETMKMGEVLPGGAKPHYGGGFYVVLSPLHFLVLKKKKKKNAVSEIF